MSRLPKFLAEHKHYSSLTSDLVSRWEYEARVRGAAPIKSQISQVKRTATTLKKSLTQFSNLSPEKELAIRGAVSAMMQLTEVAKVHAKD